MILRPLLPASHSGTAPIPAWDAIFRTQRQRAEQYWLISQDDHAHLAGEVAAALEAPWLPRLPDEIVEAIRLHDCGWRPLDDELLERARAGAQPVSFLDMSVPEFLSAWTGSIDRVAEGSPVGGSVVSVHFSRLAEYRLNLHQDGADDSQRLRAFMENEAQRRRRVTPPCGTSPIPFFTDVLQLCDLISLYICCGADAPVDFPQFEGKLRVSRDGETFQFSPSPWRTPVRISLPATPWPNRGEEEKLGAALM